MAGSPLRPAPDACYAPPDFEVGGAVNVYGRAFLVYDMDDFTKTWYASKLGRGQAQLAALDISQPERLPGLVTLPPHNGYGSAEDALQEDASLRQGT